MDIEVPSDPAAQFELRRRLRAWLELRGLAPDACNDAILAVSEACNNAIEHAYQLEQGPIHVVLRHSEGALTIRVQDRGAWHPAEPSFERGRGIPLMHALMDTAEIEHDGRGTRVSLGLLMV
jgi:anti-sigma regulatory factor (Ser/Thr protein kinase)